MKGSVKALLAFMAPVVAGCTAPPEPTEEVTPIDLVAEEAAVRVVVDQLGQVSMDEDLDLLSRILAHDADMVFFGTDAAEVLVGYEAIRESFEVQLAAYDEMRIATRDQVLRVHSGGEVAWFSQFWDVEVEAGGELVSIEGMRATGVLEKRDGAWVFVQFHGSVPVSGQAVEY